MNLQTRLLQYIFRYLKENCRQELEMHGAVVPEFTQIPRVTLAEALSIVERASNRPVCQSDLDADAERLLCQHFAQCQGVDLVFVTDYPWQARPFYAKPRPANGGSHSFDLLFRGLEITTGGQRIHEWEELVCAMRNRGLEPERFTDYLQCFKYGMPPHGGLAIGLERLTKQLLKLNNIREASLFPRDATRLSP